MFYELIYTRCRQGMDILRKGQQISSDGYKVYSCTRAIMEDGKVDLQFLNNAALAKQSYTDPSFMDDAYLFYTPDTGPGFLVNFFPVPFDAQAKGDYSHRPGNFLNHAIIGDFSGFYPYQLFKDERIWTAKTKGEAYYYENPPPAEGLPARDDIDNPPAQYSFEEIGGFIKDGREEALKKAVSFLISQYNEDHKKRKFLVIKEESSRNIELWIAAIECAFSPKIASRVPFATRMDKFTTNNKYTVKNGIYQTQISLQDPNHIHRYRGMIVGVNEQDKSNTALARPLANSPFVVLDGKQKKAEFDADISHPYFQTITRFDETHRKFCCNLLQVFNINEPGAGIFDVYEVITVLNKTELPDVRKVNDNLDKLSKYQPTNVNFLKGIYDKVYDNLQKFLNEDLSTGLNIICWLQNTSKIIGDNNAKQNLTETVCRLFKEMLFNKKDNNAKKSNWDVIKKSDFFADVAAAINNIDAIKEKLDIIYSFDPADTVTLINIYMDAASKTGGIKEDIMDFFLRTGVNGSNRNNDSKQFNDIFLIVSKTLNKNIREYRFSLLVHEKIKDEDHKKFAASYIIEQENIRRPADAEAFIKKLQEMKLEAIEVEILAHIFEQLNTKCNKKGFIECLFKMKFSEDEQSIILYAVSLASADLFKEYLKELISNAKKYKDKWNTLISSLSEDTDTDCENTLIQALTETKQKEKDLDKLCELLEGERVQKYFKGIAEKTLENKK